MPRYSRYYRGRSWGYRRGYGRYRRRYSRRSGRGTYTATKKGNKRINVSLQDRISTTLTIGANTWNTNVKAISPFGWANAVTNAIGSMVDLPTYLAYSYLFDQVKLNSISVRFNINRTLSGLVDATSDLITCVDRNGTQSDLATPMSFDQLKNSSSALRTTFNGQSTFTTTRWLSASDFMEKYTFFDATKSTTDTHAINSWVNTSQVTGFTPIIFFAMETSLATSSSSRNINLDLDITYNMTFRNPKNGMSFSSAKAAADSKASSDLVSTEVQDDIVDQMEVKQAPDETTMVEDDPGTA